MHLDSSSLRASGLIQSEGRDGGQGWEVVETNLLFYDFRFSRVFIFSTSLSFRCAQTEILPTSHLISDSSFRETASCAMS